MKAKKISQKKFILGVDIGGTGIKAQLLEVKAGTLGASAWDKTETPIKGFSAHVSQMAEIIRDADEQASKLGGSLAGIGIASPGRFSNDIIKPGTNENLGTTADSFNGRNLKAAYQQALGKTFAKTPLYVCNDANAMLAGMIDAVQKGSVKLTDQHGKEITRHSLPKQHVALFGIGTGIGHSIAKFGKDDSYEFVTDGHASKLRIDADAADWPTILKLASQLNESDKPKKILAFPDLSVRAEDVFCAPVINQLGGMTKETKGVEPHNVKQREALQFAGKYMAKVIANIHSGKTVDVTPENGWTRDDQKEAAKSSIYLIGGGGLARGPLGAEVIRYAAEELEKLSKKDKGLANIKLVQFPAEHNATRAAAMLVPNSVYRDSPAAGR